MISGTTTSKEPSQTTCDVPDSSSDGLWMMHVPGTSDGVTAGANQLVSAPKSRLQSPALVVFAVCLTQICSISPQEVASLHHTSDLTAEFPVAILPSLPQYSISGYSLNKLIPNLAPVSQERQASMSEAVALAPKIVVAIRSSSDTSGGPACPTSVA